MRNILSISNFRQIKLQLCRVIPSPSNSWNKSLASLMIKREFYFVVCMLLVYFLCLYCSISSSSESHAMLLHCSISKMALESQLEKRTGWWFVPYLSYVTYFSLRQPHSSPSVSDFPADAPATSSYSLNLPLSPSITPSLFQSRLKTYLFLQIFPTIDSLPASGLTPRLYDWSVSSEHLGFYF